MPTNQSLMARLLHISAVACFLCAQQCHGIGHASAEAGERLLMRKVAQASANARSPRTNLVRHESSQHQTGRSRAIDEPETAAPANAAGTAETETAAATTAAPQDISNVVQGHDDATDANADDAAAGGPAMPSSEGSERFDNRGVREATSVARAAGSPAAIGSDPATVSAEGADHSVRGSVNPFAFGSRMRASKNGQLAVDAFSDDGTSFSRAAIKIDEESRQAPTSKKAPHLSSQPANSPPPIKKTEYVRVVYQQGETCSTVGYKPIADEKVCAQAFASLQADRHEASAHAVSQVSLPDHAAGCFSDCPTTAFWGAARCRKFNVNAAGIADMVPSSVAKMHLVCKGAKYIWSASGVAWAVTSKAFADAKPTASSKFTDKQLEIVEKNGGTLQAGIDEKAIIAVPETTIVQPMEGKSSTTWQATTTSPPSTTAATPPPTQPATPAQPSPPPTPPTSPTPSGSASATVTVPMIVQGVGYTDLMANAAVKAEFEDGIKTTVATQTGSSVTKADVTLVLSAGSVNVEATVMVSDSANLSAVQTTLISSVSSGAMESAVVTSVQQVSGISTVSSGTITASVSTPTSAAPRGQAPVAGLLGNPVVQRQNVDDVNSGTEMQYVDSSKCFQWPGRISSIKFFAGRTSSSGIRFQVYRMLDAQKRTFRLNASTPKIPVETAPAQDFFFAHPPIPVEAGDCIGWAHEGNGVLMYDIVNEGSEGNESNGDVVLTFSSAVAENDRTEATDFQSLPSKRIYSFEVAYDVTAPTTQPTAPPTNPTPQPTESPPTSQPTAKGSAAIAEEKPWITLKKTARTLSAAKSSADARKLDCMWLFIIIGVLRLVRF